METVNGKMTNFLIFVTMHEEKNDRSSILCSI